MSNLARGATAAPLVLVLLIGYVDIALNQSRVGAGCVTVARSFQDVHLETIGCTLVVALVFGAAVRPAVHCVDLADARSSFVVRPLHIDLAGYDQTNP